MDEGRVDDMHWITYPYGYMREECLYRTRTSPYLLFESCPEIVRNFALYCTGRLLYYSSFFVHFERKIHVLGDSMQGKSCNFFKGLFSDGKISSPGSES